MHLKQFQLSSTQTLDTLQTTQQDQQSSASWMKECTTNNGVVLLVTNNSTRIVVTELHSPLVRLQEYSRYKLGLHCLLGLSTCIRSRCSFIFCRILWLCCLVQPVRCCLYVYRWCVYNTRPSRPYDTGVARAHTSSSAVYPATSSDPSTTAPWRSDRSRFHPTAVHDRWKHPWQRLYINVTIRYVGLHSENH